MSVPEPLAFKGRGLCPRELHVRSCCDAHSMSGAGQKPSTCSTPECLHSPAADILRGKIILDGPAGEKQERAQTAKRVGL
jgi:hypothetical protein